MVPFLKSLYQLARPYRRRLWLGLTFAVLAGLIEPVMVVTVVFVYSALFPSSNGPSLTERLDKAPEWMRNLLGDIATTSQTAVNEHPRAALLLVAAIPLVFFLRAVITYLNVYLLEWVAKRSAMDLQARLFGHLLNMPASFFSGSRSGELMSRVSSDAEALRNTLCHTLTTLLRDPVTLVSMAALLLWQEPRLTLMALVVLPICLVPIVVYGRKVRQSSGTIQERLADLSSQLAEAFTANRIIKAYNLEAAVVNAFRQTTERIMSLHMRLVRANELPGPMIEFVGAIGIALVLLYLALDPTRRGDSTSFLTLLLAILSLYRPIKSIARLNAMLQQARAASARVFQLLATPTSLPEPAQPKPLHAAGADLHFDHVQFAYEQQPVLADIDLVIPAGKVFALVGASGSGKTTLSNLVLRFFDPQQGAVRIGGTDIREVATRDLRNQIAVVTQETVLFNDTIRNNIRLGRPGATDAEIEEAARHAHAHEFILEKPQGYETPIGEKGVLLSGGQRQRLAIARAILRNAPILILDEATSALDTESERAVQAALQELMEHRTTICIAHRLSTIQQADCIIVMSEGRIVEQGRHPELLAQDGIYRRLYQMQFQD